MSDNSALIASTDEGEEQGLDDLVALANEDDDTPQLTNQPIKITIWVKNNCPLCTRTEKVFDDLELEYEIINVEEDTEPREEYDGYTAFDYIKQVVGIRQMPYVVIDDKIWGEVWSGFRADKLVELRLKMDAWRKERDALDGETPEEDVALVKVP